jgi:hypothetical protein
MSNHEATTQGTNNMSLTAIAEQVVESWKAAEDGPRTMRRHHMQQETYWTEMLAERCGNDYGKAFEYVAKVYGNK